MLKSHFPGWHESFGPDIVCHCRCIFEPSQRLSTHGTAWFSATYDASMAISTDHSLGTRTNSLAVLSLPKRPLSSAALRRAMGRVKVGFRVGMVENSTQPAQAAKKTPTRSGSGRVQKFPTRPDPLRGVNSL